ncbi:hypothetical protein D9M68_993190 [compost metagenome]
MRFLQGIDAGTVVVHLQAVTVPLCRQREPRPLSVLERVVDQIGHHAAQRQRVAFHRCRRTVGKLHVVSDIAQVVDHAFHQQAQIE